MNFNETSTFGDLVAGIIDIMAALVPLLIALTVVVLSWGIIKAWIINGGDETSVAKGKSLALVGVIALVVMFGFWGILAILQKSLGL